GYGLPDGNCLPCSGISGRALSISPNSSHANYKLVSNMKFLSLKCSSRSITCNASSSSYRRTPDSSGQNKRKFTRNRTNNNRHSNEERDGYEDLEGPDSFSPKNGPPLFSTSQSPKFQATASPGPREKEIVELFKKVQAQLRERAASKDEVKKVETPQGKSKESETVDSLLKLLRKHSVQQSKKSYVSAENRDFVLNQTESANQVEANQVERKVQESPGQNLGRPKSSFRKRSPVPEVKFQPIYSQGGVDLDSGKNEASLEVEEVESESESESDVGFSEENDLDEISENEISEFFENEHEGVVGKQSMVELRAVAKSRGLKGYSKLKKSELVELLSGSSV
ncbi:rho-n domain-containing protein 1 chloroplastic, partial [Phtheirospermum japonicum]